MPKKSPQTMMKEAKHHMEVGKKMMMKAKQMQKMMKQK